MSISNLFIQNSNNLECNTLHITSAFQPTNSTDPVFEVNGNTINTGINIFSNTTDSTNYTSGAIQISGGLGIQKSLFVQNNVYIGNTLTVKNLVYEEFQIITSTDNSISPSTGALVVEGGSGIVKDLYVGGNLYIYGSNNVTGNSNLIGLVNITNTIDSTSISTGSMVINGGCSIYKNLNVGGNINGNFIGTISTNTINSTSVSTGSIVVNGGIGIQKDVYIGGVSHFLNTTQSTNINTGSIVVNGGIGIGQNVNIGQNLNVLGQCSVYSEVVVSTLDSNARDIGSLVINGGVGVAKTINCQQLACDAIYSVLVDLQKDNPSVVKSADISQSIDSLYGMIIDSPSSQPTAPSFAICMSSDGHDDVNSYRAQIITSGPVVDLDINCPINISTTTGTSINIQSTTNSISSSTGSMVLNGGAAITKDLYLGGSLISSSVPLFTYNNVVLTKSNLTTTTNITCYRNGNMRIIYIGAFSIGVTTASAAITFSIPKLDSSFLPNPNPISCAIAAQNGSTPGCVYLTVLGNFTIYNYSGNSFPTTSVNFINFTMTYFLP